MKSKKTLVIEGEPKALNLRLPLQLHQRITDKAQAEGKSINLVIVELLQIGFKGSRVGAK